MINRTRHMEAIIELLGQFPVTAIIGSRQVGKTTLARQIAQQFDGRVSFFDLDDPRDEARLQEPMMALEALDGLVIVDEVQHNPELFRILRVLADQKGTSARYLVLGSASPVLLEQSSQTLAGRIAYHELTPFQFDETGDPDFHSLWQRGGYPLSFLARSDSESLRWRREFIKTYLERDIPQLGITVSSTTLRRFWIMLAHCHGELWNASALAQSFGVSDMTVRRYLDILTATFVARQLLPWHENTRKRQVKSPKVYLADSGVLHALLGIATPEDLEGHPKAGASFEGMVIQMLAQRYRALPEECFFWRTHTGAELDFLIVRGNRRYGFEIKMTLAPKTTRSMHSALSDLNLESLRVVYPGRERFAMAPNIIALPLSQIFDEPLDLADLS